MQKGQELTVTLDAGELYSAAEKLDNHAIASRLSEAIIDTVRIQKKKGWAMINMEFNSGLVTIHFQKPNKHKAKTSKDTPKKGTKSSKKGDTL